jgi:hypothetical protein
MSTIPDRLRRPRRAWSTAVLAALLVPTLGIPGDAAPLAYQAARPGVYERWAEVITATREWLVLQDEEGKQYPVSLNAIGLFVTRWPTTLDRISPDALVEATGVDADSNRILTDHLDVFEGAARNMVVPGLVLITGSGRAYRPIDFTFNADAYGDPFPGLGPPIQGGVNTNPARMHIVGPLVRKAPVMIGWEGNNAMTVLAPPQGVSMSQITPGSAADIRPGDLVYFAAVDARPKSLVLEQLVVYKSMPIDQFVR